MTTTATRHRTHRCAALVGALTLTVLLAACGSSDSTAAASGDAAANSTGQGPRTPPGVTGQIAVVTGTTLQVQSTTAQTAVAYTATTPITTVAAATLVDITTGLCATARPNPDDTTAATTTLTAATIALSTPVNGVCPAGVGGGGGAPGPRGSAPASAPAPAPASGTGSRPAGAGPGANGLITAVSGDTVTIASLAPPGGASPTSTTPTATTSTTTIVTVTTTSSTTVTKAQPGTAADLVVGACVTALGTADTTGAITATALTIRPQVNGTCGSGGRGGQGQRTTTGA